MIDQKEISLHIVLVMEKKKKIIVGMSSGVDSSVSAALLKKQGFDVLGFFILMQGDSEKTKKEIDDVKKVCDVLKISLKIIDARKRFKDEVIGYFLKEYATGKTPNPCVYCNENLKLKILFEEMKKEKACAVATGHYAKIKKNRKVYKLFEAKDENKDQSYFLYRLSQKQLEKIVFPLGDYEKKEVRELAKKFNLPVWEKKESQDVCFLAGLEINDFLQKNIKMKKGDIVDEVGKKIGRHAGLPLYTLGQRKGIEIGGTGPYYVFKKDYAKNLLVVTNEKKGETLFSKEAVLEAVNWISDIPKLPTRLQSRIRYRSELCYTTIKRHKSRYIIEFEKPQRAVTPGQSVVFYSKKGEVIGGGIICK